MKISVIIPVYNVEKYIDECIVSVLKIKTDMEILLIDDGSTDNSGKICDSWEKRDKRIKVYHKTNGGLSSARNLGIRKSSGDFVMFLDSDDFLDSEQTEHLLQNIDYDKNLLMGFYRNYYSENGLYVKECTNMMDKIQGVISIEEFLKKVPQDGQQLYMIACRFIAKRSFLIDNKLYFSEGIYHEDEEWTQRLLMVTKTVCVCPYFFYQYRQGRDGAITGKVRVKNVEDRFTIIEKTKVLLEENCLNEVKVSYLKNRMAQLYISNMIDCNNFEKDDREKIQKKLMSLKKDCMPYMRGKIGISIRIFGNIFGVKLTCYFLKLARRLIKGN